MITHPNCKINLGLHVVSKRPDGYHNLETLFLPVTALHDELEILPAEHFTFRQEGIPVDCPADDNICVKAYHLMQQRFPEQVGPVAMRLQKNIPFGAGLGGGSADAAFVLTMLNQLYQLQQSPAQLRALAVTLGADCPFFIDNTPMYATGIGDELEPCPLDLEALRLRVEIRKPDEGVSTREAYAGIRPHSSTVDLRQAVRRPVEEWRELIVNDFEASVFPQHPIIAEYKQQLYADGALYASMSGSGSALFGLFRI